MVNELSNLVLNRDVWQLAEIATIQKCLKMGMSPIDVKNINDIIKRVKEENYSNNPISSMF